MTPNQSDAEALDAEALDDDPAPSAEKFNPPSDGSWIPRGRFDAVLNKVTQLTEQMQKIEAAKAPAVSTRSDLLKSVDEGEMSQEEADAIWEKNIEDRVTKTVVQATESRNVETDLATKLKEYETAIPALLDESSDTYLKASKEYGYLTNTLKQVPGPGTMLSALRTTLGPVEKLKSTLKLNRVEETHQETGGGSGSPAGSDSDNTRWGSLTSRQRKYYDHAIEVGAYPNGREEVLEMHGKGKKKKKA